MPPAEVVPGITRYTYPIERMLTTSTYQGEQIAEERTPKGNNLATMREEAKGAFEHIERDGRGGKQRVHRIQGPLLLVLRKPNLHIFRIEFEAEVNDNTPI